MKDRTFNLNKRAQFPPPMMEEQVGDPYAQEPLQEDMSPELEGTTFEKGSDLDAFLAEKPREEGELWFQENISGDSLDKARELIEEYYDAPSPFEREKAAERILESGILPIEMTEQVQEGIMETEYHEYNPDAHHKEMMAFVQDVNNQIKKLASESCKKEAKKSFNLHKEAQAQTASYSYFMYGPEQTRMDPFLRQPVSDWSVVERNKGFGLVVDNIWNIDWETLWRGNVMDKYSRAYKDKEGNWVGGYLNKRFEIDSWIPEGNNLQLKPGEKRKTYLPEYALTEARLEAMRSKADYQKTHKPDSSGRPFNWKNAQIEDVAKKLAAVSNDPNLVIGGPVAARKRAFKKKEADNQNPVKEAFDASIVGFARQINSEMEQGARMGMNAIVARFMDEMPLNAEEVVFVVDGQDRNDYQVPFAASPAAEQPSYRMLEGDDLRAAVEDEARKVVAREIESAWASMPEKEMLAAGTKKKKKSKLICNPFPR